MSDLATLGIRVEGQEVVTADQQLDGLAGAAAKAETATERLAAAARGNGAAMMTMNTAVRQQSAVLGAARSSMGLTTAEGLNMGRQLSDVGVQLAMGMSPFMIAVQQGPQIFDVFQMAAIRAGTSIRAAMVATGAAVWTALAPLLPIIAAIALAAGALAAGWGLASRSISSGIGDVTKEMGLTEDQLERLKEKNTTTTATMGDAWNGLGTTIKEMFVSVFGDQLSWVDRQWNSFLDDLTSNTGKEVDAIAGFFVGAYYVIRDTWKLLPAALGDAAYTTVRAIIGSLQFLIDRSVAGINSLREKYNTLPDWMRSGHVAPMLGGVQLGMPSNPNAGAMNALGGAAGSSFATGFESQRGASGRFMDTWRQNTRDSAIARVRGDAGDAGGDAEGTARAAREVREVMMAVERTNLQPLTAFVESVVDPLKLAADELRLVNGLANDMAQGLTSAFGQSGAALGDLLTTMTSYQARLADINLAEREYRLSATQADRERAMAQVQNYGDMIGAARGFFEEGSDGYKALQAAEQAYRVFQFAMMVQSMVLGGQETAATVGQNAIKALSHGVVAVARAIASLPFPFNLAAGAATIAALAAIGVRIAGGGGGGSTAAATGSGTGFGSAGATEQIRGQTRAAQAGQQSFAAAIAQQINVVVTADREGMNAYVVGTARSEAQGVAGPMIASSEKKMSKALPAKVNRGIATGMIGEPAWGVG